MSRYIPTQVQTCEMKQRDGTTCTADVDRREWVEVQGQTVCLSLCEYHYWNLKDSGWFQ